MGDSNLLFLGDGTGRFTDVSVTAGLNDMGSGQGACFADIDGDGDLDLFVANFGETDIMYLNDGNGVFADVTATAGVQSDGVNGFGCVFADFDEDGDMDLYVSNDGALNKLFVNNGQGIFADRTAEAGAGATIGGGRGVQAADFNGDGHLDLYAVVATGSHTFLLGRGDGTFTDATSSSGINSHSGIAQGVNAADFDGDGDIDIIVSVLNNDNVVFQNDGTGKFRDVSRGAGSTWNKFGQGVAFGDVNGDGELDAFVASYGRYFPLCPFCSATNSLLINQLEAPAWLKVRPTGPAGATLLGAEVRVFEAGTQKPAAARAQIDGGSGFCSQNAYEAYFGLSTAVAGGASQFDVQVSLAGVTVTKRNIAPNQVVEVHMSDPSFLQKEVSMAGSLWSDEPGRAGRGGSGQSFGVAMADVDGDGDLDVFVTNSGSANEFYINDGQGNFVDAAESSGLAVARFASRGAAFADVNGDGKLDLFMSAYGDANLLMLGDGTGRFAEKVDAGLSDMGSGQGACFADIDADGDLDLFVANFGESDRLYLNDGLGVFTDATAAAGVESDGVNGFGCVFGDFDEDGDLDLYVNNDGALNKLFINNGQGIFSDRTAEAGAGATTGGGRAVQAADFNGDGHLDLVAVVATGSHTLLMNRGDGTFTDASSSSGINGHSGVAQGVNAADFDGDGDIDFIVSVLNNNNVIFRNDGQGRFTDVSSGSGTSWNKWGQGVAFGDLDGDGQLDAFIGSYGRFFPLCPFCSSTNSLLINQLDVPAWLKVRPTGSTGATLIGAEVRVFEAGTQTPAAARAQIDGGSGFCSQNAYEAYFGLSTAVAGGASQFDVQVSSGGVTVTRRGVAPNQVVEVRV